MSQLQLTCLGDFQVTLVGEPLTAFQTDKMRALLVYLALEGQPHARRDLTEFLWPGYSEESARNSFRQYLHQLRQILGDAEAAPGGAPWLLVTRQTVQFNPAAPLQLDVARFAQLISETATHPHEQLTTCQPCLTRLGEAAALYRGNFLAGFTLADSDPFEEWRQLTQEQLHLQALNLLHCLAGAAALAGDDKVVQHYAQRQLALEPWCEAAHRQLMRSLARSGRRQAALAQYQLCREVIAAELGAAPEAKTLALYEQIRSGKLDKVTSTSSVTLSSCHPVTLSSCHPVNSSPPHNLPAQLTPFIGRDRELATLIGQLGNPNVRLVTLVGVGGIGKTRLALEAGKTIVEYGVERAEYEMDALPTLDSPRRTPLFADGVFFVSLAPIQRASEMALTVATALGVTLGGGDPFQTLLRFLQPKRLLLLLDNFEHLLGAPPAATGDNQPSASRLVSELLQSAPHLKILVTSRERLNVRGEHLYRVEGMDHTLRIELPALGTRLAGEHLLAAANNLPAVQLFSQGVRQVQSDYAVTAADLEAVLQICNLVQGMPLGIEMAAAWAAQLPLRAIADEIQRSSDFLTVDWPDAPPRQRSMRAVFDWSWHLLNAAEQRVLRQLTVFRDGFTRAAAEAIAGASLPVLVSLVNKSLLQRKEERYALHELLRQFAEEQLIEAGAEWDATAARHSDYYLAFVAEREVRLVRHEPRQAANEISREINNFRQAWRWAVAHLRLPALDRCLYSFWQFYMFIQPSGEGEQLIKSAIDALTTADIVTTPGSFEQALYSKFLALHAYWLNRLGKWREALACAEQAIALGDVSENREGKVLGSLYSGFIYCRIGEGEKAATWLEQALHLAHTYQTSDPVNELWPEVIWLAYLHLGTSNLPKLEEEPYYQAAQGYLREALAICQRLGKVRGEVLCLMNLGTIALHAGHWGAARQTSEQGLPSVRALGSRWLEGGSLVELGKAVYMLGDYGQAQAYLEQGWGIMHELNDSYHETYATINLVRLYADLGDNTRAQQWLQRSSKVSHSATDILEVDRWLANAALAQQQEDYGAMLAAATQAGQMAGKVNSRSGQAHSLVLMGHAQAARQNWSAAGAAYDQALTLYIALDKVAWATEAQAGLSVTALAQADLKLALHQVEAILPVLAEQPMAGIDEPFLVYLTCYRVLMAADDPRAVTVLQRGHELLQQYAHHIQDDALRASFLEKVPVHRALHQAYINAPGLYASGS